MAKWVYLFEEGNADMRNLLGGKGANLAEMTNLGLPIPQGFTVTTEACTDYYNNGKQISEEIQKQIFDALEILEKKQEKKFGDTENPLLVSVRSGARASMPGMMDTILNLGLTDIAVEGFAKRPEIRGSHTILTEDLSRCSPMLLWRFPNLISKEFSMKLKPPKELPMIRN